VAWHTVDGGGGASAGGGFALKGTIGQPDASGALTGGAYSVVGGYWAGLGASTPTVGSPSATAVGATIANLNANVTSDGGAAITDRGVVYSVTTANNDPVIGGGSVTQVSTSGTTGIFGIGVTGLSPSTGYSFKAYATNGVGTSYTTVATFTTATPPSFVATAARTLAPDSISQSQLSALVPEIWYRARLFANRSYQISVWPVDHEQGVDAPDLAVTLFSDDAGTTPAAGVSGGSGSLEATANSGGDNKPFTAIVQPPATGVYKIRVQRLSGGSVSHSVNLMLRETTLFSPWTSRAAGFEGFVELHNNTNAAISVTLRAFDSTGALQGVGVTLTLQPNATDFKTASQIGVAVNVFAGVVLTHDGAFGAVSANITTLNGANGLSFDSPFGLRAPSIQAHPVR
jgi:hypothetical protein